MKIRICAVAGLLLLAGCAQDQRAPHPVMFDPMSPSAMVFFAFDSAEITAPNLSFLRNFAEAAGKVSGGGRVFVCGHADRAGGAAANMAISQERADAVRRALIGLGIPADRIVVSARGDRQPLVAVDGQEEQNRRVDVNLEHLMGLGVQSCQIR